MLERCTFTFVILKLRFVNLSYKHKRKKSQKWITNSTLFLRKKLIYQIGCRNIIQQNTVIKKNTFSEKKCLRKVIISRAVKINICSNCDQSIKIGKGLLNTTKIKFLRVPKFLKGRWCQFG